MFELLFLDASHLMNMFLWEDFTVLDGLQSGVVVILMNLSCYRFLFHNLLNRSDHLTYDSRCLSLVDGSIMMASSPDELGDSGFGSVHVDSGIYVVVMGDDWWLV